jgi:ankyrin repeat protein
VQAFRAPFVQALLVEVRLSYLLLYFYRCCLAKILAGFEDFCDHDGVAPEPFVLPFLRDDDDDDDNNSSLLPVRNNSVSSRNMNVTNMAPPEWDLLLGAAQKDRPDELTRLVKMDGVAASHANGVGQSALHIAALWGHVSSVRTLCALGANPSAANRLSGATPLHMVVQSRKVSHVRRLPIVQSLLEAGADASQADDAGALPVDYLLATNGGSGPVDPTTTTTATDATGSTEEEDEAVLVERIRALLQPQEPVLWSAMAAADLAHVQALLLADKAPADTPQLPLPTYRNVTTVAQAVKLLLAEADDKDGKEQPPAELLVDVKVLAARLAILEALLEYSPSAVATTTSHGAAAANETNDVVYEEDKPLGLLLTALERRLSMNDVDVATATQTQEWPALVCVWAQAAQRLQASPEQASSEDFRGHVWRSASSRRRNYSFCVLLWRYALAGPLLGTNRQGMTVLHYAARSGQMQAVKFLLTSLGAAAAEDLTRLVQATDDRGRTARQAAETNGHAAVVALLDDFMCSTTTATEE